MAYTVTKYVKGRAYLYRQESYRIGDEVHTRSVYLGPFDPVTRTVRKVSPADPNAVGDVRQQTRDRIIITGNQEPTPSKASVQSPTDFHGSLKGLHVKIHCQSKYINISRRALEHCWTENQKRLLDIGIFPSKIPEISIEYGIRVRVYKRIFSNTYVVTLPRKARKAREKLRFEYFRAISLASIEALRKERPDLHSKLSLHFTEKFLQTQKLIARYVETTNDRSAFAKVLMLRFFGDIPAWIRKKLKPERLGLVEYGVRKTWQDDAVPMMAEILKYGWKKAYGNCFVEIKKAQGAEQKILDDTSIWGSFKRKKLDRVRLRIKLNEVKLEKLKILKSIFGYSK